jgi:hypothetical protein
MASGAPSVIAQEPAAPPATQAPTFRSGVDLITVDVGVVDGRGNPVADLGAAEFSVKIDGEIRRVVSAELVKVDLEAAKKVVADKSETFYTSNLTPANGRQIVIAVDQMHIRPGPSADHGRGLALSRSLSPLTRSPSSSPEPVARQLHRQAAPSPRHAGLI